MTIQAHVISDDEFCPPPPPSADLNDRVVSMLQAFGQAGNNTFSTWSMERGFGQFRRIDFRTSTISEEERDELLTEIARARMAAEQSFGAEYDRRKIAIGMDAAVAFVVLWSETEAQRAAREALVPGYEKDVRAVAAMFRNDLQNMVIADQIRDRAEKREAAKREIAAPWAHSDEAAA